MTKNPEGHQTHEMATMDLIESEAHRIDRAVRIFTQDGVQIVGGMTCWDFLGQSYKIAFAECSKHGDSYTITVRDARSRVSWCNLFADKEKAREACAASFTDWKNVWIGDKDADQ